MSPANLCRHCGMREDWHSYDGECPDDEGPHPYSEQADRLETEPQYGAPEPVLMLADDRRPS